MPGVYLGRIAGASYCKSWGKLRLTSSVFRKFKQTTTRLSYCPSSPREGTRDFSSRRPASPWAVTER